MSSDPSTPATDRVKKFARNFRNAGNVENYGITRYDNNSFTNITVYLNPDGMNFDLIRERGWTFDIFDITLGANRVIVHIRLYDEGVDGWQDVLDGEDGTTETKSAHEVAK